MKIHTSNFKNEIKTLGKQQTVRITYTLNDEIKIIDSEDINSATPNYEGNLLKSVMKVLDLDSNIDIPKDTEIKFEYGLLVDGSYEYLNYGNYIVYSSEKQEDTLSYNIKCYDKLLYSMKDYEELDIVYPKTIKQYLIALCTKIGLEFKDSTFANQDRIVSSDLFKGLDYTYRDVLDQIAETTGGCICLTTDDKVEVRYTNKLVEYEEKNKIKEATFDSEINENLVVDKVYGSTSQETREESKSVLTGSEIVVNDTYIDNKTQFIIDGNSEQNTYEGYNLCNISNQTINGVTIINSNNGLILNGTCSSTFSIVALKQKVEAGDYIIKKLGDGASNATYQSVIYKNNNIVAYVAKTNKSITFENDDEIRLQLYIYSGTVFNNLILPVQVCKDNDRPYEPYTGGIPSPNLDYPQEIEVIDGVNKFNLDYIEQSFSKVVTDTGVNLIKCWGTQTFNNEKVLKTFKPNTTYTMKAKAKVVSRPSTILSHQYGTMLLYRPGSSSLGSVATPVLQMADKETITLDTEKEYITTFITPADLTDMRLLAYSFYGNDDGSTTGAPQGEIDLTEVMLVEGTYTEDNFPEYLSYGNIGIEQSGKNKLNVTAASKTFAEGITVTVNEDKSITINGTNNSSSTLYFRLADNFVLPAGSYTLSNENSNVSNDNFIFYDDNNKFPRKNISNATFTEDVTIKPYIKILYGATVNNQTIYPMIVEGAYSETTLPAYEPYHEPIITSINLQGNILSKIGDVKDILRVNRNGEVKINKKIGEIVLDGSEDEKWSLSATNNSNQSRFTSKIIENKVKRPVSVDEIANIICSHFIKESTNDTYKRKDGIAVHPNGSIYLYNNTFKEYTIDQFKTWLSNNPITVEYELATPQTITLPSISPIELEQGTNIFKLISNLDTTMELTYNYISAMPSTETPSKINNAESINIKIQNENLFDEKFFTDSGFLRNDNDYYYGSATDLLRYKKLPNSFNENTQYIISFNAYDPTITNGRGLFFEVKYTDNSKYDININSSSAKDYMYISDSNKTIDCITCLTGGFGTETYIKNFMINEGTTTKPYIKHKEQNISFNLDKPLCENCYLAEDGIHYNRTQNVVNITSAVKLSNGNVAGVYDPPNKTSKQNNLLICSKAKFERTYKTNTVYENPASVVFVGEETDTLDTLKQKFDGAILEYELKNEIIVPYTEKQKRSWKNLQKLISYTGKNYVESTTDIDIKFPINRDTVDEEYINDTNVNFGEKYGPINSIVLARAGEADKIYIKNQESIEENGLCELMISENQFMNFNDRSDYLQELSDELFGVEYYLNDFVSTGIMYYDLLDMYNIKIDDNKYKCLMLNDEQCITQGLEENIHTDMPEKSETDYTKADKTDRRINQTYLIVDKQNQQIEGIVNQIGDRTDKTTTITADIDGLTSKVSTIADLTNDINGTKSVSLEKCVAGEIVELHILGNNSVFKYQYLDDSLYLNDNLILGKDRSIIIITDENGNKTYNDLRIEEVLRQNGSVYDEYILKDGQAQIIRRINKDGTIKDNEEIEDLGEFHIPLSKGNNTLEIKDFSANIYVKWAVQNEYTDMFATKAEMNSNIKQTSQEINLSVDKKFENYSTTTEINSSITQTAESINSEVRKKVGEDEIISKINQSAEAVSIDAQKININGAISANGNFQVDTDGNMICNNGQFNGGKVSLLDNPEDDDSRLEITSSGAETKIYSDGLYINNSSGSATLRIWIICR